MAQPEYQRIARRLHTLERNLSGLSTPQLAHSSIEDGSVDEYDAAGNLVSVVGKQFDGTHGAVAFQGPVPPVPSVPLVSGGAGTFSAGWDGFFAGGAARPLDLHFVRVTARAEGGAPFTVGTLVASGSVVATVPAGVYEVTLSAESQPGLTSAPSVVAFVAVVEPTNQALLLQEIEAANLRLDGARAELAAADQQLSEALAASDTDQAALAATLSTLKNTTIPALDGELTAAEGRLTEAEMDIATTFTTLNAVPTQISTAKQEAITAAKAEDVAIRAAAAQAQADALAASGLAGSKGRVWFVQPPEGRVHAWTGPISNSISVQRRDGVELRRNFVGDPRATTLNRSWSTGRWFGANGGAGTQAIVTGTGPDGAETTMFRKAWTAAPTGNGDTGLVVGPWSTSAPIVGVEYTFSGYLRPNTSGVKNAAARAFWYRSDGTLIKTAAQSVFALKNNEWNLLSVTAVTPAEAVRVTTILDIVGGGVAWAPGESLDGTFAMFEVGQLRAYFDGSSPDERVGDLWVDAGAQNTPKRWNPDTNAWAPVTDQAAIDAAKAAAALDATAKANAALAAAKDDATQKDTAVQAAAASDATTKADAAKAVANTAQQAAAAAGADALAAAGLAGSKGEVIYQLSAPTGTRAVVQNLWIRSTDNKPHRWNPDSTETNKWESVTDQAAIDAATQAGAAQQAADQAKADALAAQARADDAYTLAGTAKSTADTALTSANGKNTVTRSLAAPAGSGARAGDIHWRFADDTYRVVIAEWTWDGDSWEFQKQGHQTIASVDLGALTVVGTATITNAVALKIAAETAAFQKADIGNLTVTGTSALSTVVAQKIAADSGQYVQLDVGQLRASTAVIPSAVIDKLFADVVKARTVTATEGFIGGNAILTGAITAPKITASEELWAKIGQFASITSGMIVTGALDGKLITGAIIRTAATGARVQIDQNGLFAYNSAGAETARINGVSNLLSGRLTTNMPGEPGIILVPTTSTGKPGIWLTSTGSAGGDEAAIYADESWNLVLRGLRQPGATIRNGVYIEGGLQISTGAVSHANASWVISTGGRFTGTSITTSSADTSNFNNPSTFRGETRFEAISRFIGYVSSGGGMQTNDFFLMDPPTSTFSANVGISVSPKDRFYKLTSARKYKYAIDKYPEKTAWGILALSPSTWFDSYQTDAYADWMTDEHSVEEELEGIAPLRRIPGLVAEEVEAAGLREYCTYDEAGAIEGIAYDRLWTLLLPIVADINRRLTTIEGQPPWTAPTATPALTSSQSTSTK